MNRNSYDIIVVGGGHAGCEAAAAAARMGCSVLLLTMSAENLGELSCNPAIGGLGKGQIVREVDALGGILGRAADAAGIHFKRLNMSRGAAVRSTRAQADRELFKKYVSEAMFSVKDLSVLEGTADSVVEKSGSACGVKLLSGEIIKARAVILTPGTFPGGKIFTGLKSTGGGRAGEPAAAGISESLRGLGLKMLRFKTGTCARLDGKTIDFSGLIEQKPDDPPTPFSIMTETITNAQLPCHITHTNAQTHEIIRSGLDRSPLFTGMIEGTGVRYCPSIEDKLVKFPQAERHQVFLEPEALNSGVYYPNGISTSLPEEVQESFIRSIKGLERVKIIRFGYGIEYDLVNPLELRATLETRKLRNLYLAGQINGTTGYEEAAGQGIVAGINAAARILEMEPLVLARHEAYIGVMIDDLITLGTKEPYRMFTSRAEYRLMLREDNAHLRLTEKGRGYGCVDEKLYRRVSEYIDELEKSRKILENEKLNTGRERIEAVKAIRSGKSWSDVSGISEKLREIPEYIGSVLETEIKYEGYINRHIREIGRLKKMSMVKIPSNTDYSRLGGLSREAVEKLEERRPGTLYEASKIPGMTSAAVMTIMIYLKGVSGSA